jgi:integrase/recombinase XerC
VPALLMPAAELDAPRLILSRLGITLEDLLRDEADRPPARTFAEYVPVVSAAVSADTRAGVRLLPEPAGRELGGTQRMNEPSPSEVKHLSEHVRDHVRRHNSRGRRLASEHLVAALRCLCNHAIAVGVPVGHYGYGLAPRVPTPTRFDLIAPKGPKCGPSDLRQSPLPNV